MAINATSRANDDSHRDTYPCRMTQGCSHLIARGSPRFIGSKLRMECDNTLSRHGDVPGMFLLVLDEIYFEALPKL